VPVSSPNGCNASEAEKSFLGRWWLTILSIVLVIVLGVVWLVANHGGTNLKTMGYPGAFLVSMLAGATLFIPIPGSPAVFALGGVLTPWILGPVAGFGEAIGEFTGYLAGRGGNHAIKDRLQERYDRVERLVKGRWGVLTIFFNASLLNPLFDLFGFAAGAARMPVWRFFLACWAGKTIKNTALAYAGLWGMGFLLRWMGIHVD
jgi:membrane protein YqaA with SNARE-associated domain